MMGTLRFAHPTGFPSIPDGTIEIEIAIEIEIE
jgi:hypothetical protein